MRRFLAVHAANYGDVLAQESQIQQAKQTVLARGPPCCLDGSRACTAAPPTVCVPTTLPDSERCSLQRLVVPSTAYRAWVARVSAREEGECLFGSTELSVPAHKVIAQCTRTFVSHSDRSLGSGAWRIGNKNSPFGCRFSSVALGVSCFPPCSLLPLPAPGLPRDSGRLALNTTPSLLTSSPT